MYTPEKIRQGAARFDGYAVAMSVLTTPTEYSLVGDDRSPQEKLAIIKGIAIASLQEVVTIGKPQTCTDRDVLTGFFQDIVELYFASETALRLSEPVRLFRPNPLKYESFQNKIIKRRTDRIAITDLTAGMPIHSTYDAAVEADRAKARTAH